MTNIYTMEGGGPGYGYEFGVCMISRQNRIGFSLSEANSGTNSLLRSSIGSFNTKNGTGKTQGSIEPFGAGNNIQFNVVRFS